MDAVRCNGRPQHASLPCGFAVLFSTRTQRGGLPLSSVIVEAPTFCHASYRSYFPHGHHPKIDHPGRCRRVRLLDLDPIGRNLPDREGSAQVVARDPATHSFDTHGTAAPCFRIVNMFQLVQHPSPPQRSAGHFSPAMVGPRRAFLFEQDDVCLEPPACALPRRPSGKS